LPEHDEVHGILLLHRVCPEFLVESAQQVLHVVGRVAEGNEFVFFARSRTAGRVVSDEHGGVAGEVEVHVFQQHDHVLEVLVRCQVELGLLHAYEFAHVVQLDHVVGLSPYSSVGNFGNIPKLVTLLHFV